MNTPSTFRAGFGILICIYIAAAQPRPIDIQNSSMTIRVFKAGAFSALGHNHEIAAPIAGGSVDIGNRRVQLRCNARALRVVDRDASDKDRQDIQKTMLGPEVLSADRYPEIVFQSGAAEPAGAGAWTVSGELTLHGQTKPITLQAQERDGRYVGTARLKQTDFGIKPVKTAGGLVRVKDEVQVEFEVQLMQEQSTQNRTGK